MEKESYKYHTREERIQLLTLIPECWSRESSFLFQWHWISRVQTYKGNPLWPWVVEPQPKHGLGGLLGVTFCFRYVEDNQKPCTLGSCCKWVWSHCITSKAYVGKGLTFGWSYLNQSYSSPNMALWSEGQ